MSNISGIIIIIIMIPMNSYFAEGLKPPAGKQSGTPAKSSVGIICHWNSAFLVAGIQDSPLAREYGTMAISMHTKGPRGTPH